MVEFWGKRMAKNKLVSPFVKWVGGKRQLLQEIEQELPKDLMRLKYFEPFVGGGAVFFHLQPRKAAINDANPELVNAYEVIKADVEGLIENLKIHKNEADYFYEIRALDRENQFFSLTNIERASRFIYLNKTCFNGLYRVNNSGEFNSPFGRYENPNIVNEPVLRSLAHFLNLNDIKITNLDYVDALKKIGKNSFVYYDPPYHPVSSSSNFTGYVAGGWDELEQRRLRDLCDQLTEKGVKFLLSNSSAPLIFDLYKKYKIKTIKAARSINSVGSKRGVVDEVLVMNYGETPPIKVSSSSSL
jgi:DNA adenine methylase